MSIKIGIIGAGGMANYHIPGFRQAGAEVVALCDVSEVAARRAADKHGIAKIFTEVAELLRSPGLDAVSVIVPNKFHAPLALQALAAGKHVFCEKPPAINANEMAAMLAAARQAKRTLMFNFNNRARPESYAMMDFIKAGRVGTINTCQAKWIRRAGIPGFGGWFTTKALSGGGPLIDLLHMVDLGLYFMGNPEPAHVLARTYQDHITDKSFKGPWGIPDVANGVTDVESAAHGFVTFKSGQAMSFQVSWAEMNLREEVSVTFQGVAAGGLIRRLFGVDGIDSTAIDSCELYTQDHGRTVNQTVLVPPDETMGRVRSAMNFVRAVEGTEPPLNTPEQALALMKIIDGAYQSAATGRPVTF
ncbi:MAG TPA: Gfo/Idh/MocA family oxidoreductase [Lacunisphaera sp.]|jgi:predicted dehydrogenase|nr:Gfo/Idh/MocA family oxidoreductase [Lacunisphaera sp.]